MARDRLQTGGHRRKREAHAPVASSPPLVALQRSAGNAAVTGLIQRDLLHDARQQVDAIECTVNTEISLALAQKAKTAAAGGVSDAELRTLRSEALSDDTITDDERMFLAGLLDSTNASTVAGARIAAGTKFTFSRASIE